MPALRNYHILISHSWDYNDQYEKVKKWLNDAPYFSWNDYSVPLTKPLAVESKTELKKKLVGRISMCSCIIILSGMYVPYSEWIDFEIDAAVAFNKPIIGVESWGQERIPVKVKTYAKKMVGWNSSSIIDAVRYYAL